MSYHKEKPINDHNLASPNPSELESLAVLWAEQKGENKPLKLSEIHKRVCERRHEYGLPDPALTTISTHLIALTNKGLIRRMNSESKSYPDRGILTPSTRSPNTSYQAIYDPSDVLKSTYRALADSYPPNHRLDAILDFANALGISVKVINEGGIEILMRTTKCSNSKAYARKMKGDK